MKKTLVTVVLVGGIIATMLIPVSAGTKKTDSFTLKSYFVNKIETVYVKTPLSVYYNLDIGTDSVWAKNYNGRLNSRSEIFQSGPGLFNWSWSSATMGYVTGKVDGVKISFTDR